MKNINKMTKNNKQSDYIFCHPCECEDPGLDSKSTRLDSRLHGNDNSAFTVLFAVIVSSLILALGLGIVAITMKEVKLSGAGRDSQVAFYAADSGLECAEYFDITQDVFATSSDSAATRNITCNYSQTIIATSTKDNSSAATTTFRMCMEYDGVLCVLTKPCADVTVAKYIEGVQKKTNIDSRGYNTCDPSNQRRLERGYSVEYDSEW